MAPFPLVLLAALAVELAAVAVPAPARAARVAAAAADAPASRGVPPAELARWERRARAVTITRDDWGIAHVHGRTDADAVFGMVYAQAEDDFPRVEMNYIQALGRVAEVEGDSAIFQDLRMKLFVDPDTLQRLYRASPGWLRELMDAFADGLNYYLHTHPMVYRRLLLRFEPWMALAFTEGSIGGDIERVDVAELAAFYGDSAASRPPLAKDGDGEDPSGSNGIAIAPRLTRDGHTLLWINPHTSFYFRSELQMTSDEGLDAYGAVTWGQFFVYQGFNRTAGWMHTSSGVDNIDEFLETVEERGGRLYTREGADAVPLRSRRVVVPYRHGHERRERAFTVYDTPRGPVVRKAGDRWVSVSLMRRPIESLIQSFRRTKARDLDGFRREMERHSNSSNNTVFADARGNIAYFHSNWIPKRDTSFDWTRPVEARDPATRHRGLLSFAESPNVVNPASGWVFNVNNWPWTAAGPGSLDRAAYPRYVETGAEETARGQHALRLLTGRSGWTMRSLTAAAFDPDLPAFERLVPVVVRAYDESPPGDSLRERVRAEVEALRGWDHRWSASSIPTTLAVHWGELMVRRVTRDARGARVPVQAWIATRVPPRDLLAGLAAASDSIAAAFGTWRTPWGEVNRFQRIHPGITPRFDDTQPSLAVPFTSGTWGSLAAFNARRYPGTRRWYGNSGNSFVAVVEFADSVRAMAVTAGGASGHPDSPHFDDQMERFVGGDLREVYFWPSQRVGHVVREYRPGR